VALDQVFGDVNIWQFRLCSAHAMSGMFDLPVGDPVNGVVGGYPPKKGPKCDKCGSTDTEAISRDIVWEETTCRCNKCGHVFIKG
jgi:hypothetical protein